MPFLVRDRRMAQELHEAWRRDPVTYARSVLGVDPWLGARRVMRAMSRPHAQVVVHGAHAMGKSHTAACWALAWASAGGTVVVTAAKLAQVEHGFWHDLRLLVEASRVPFGAEPLMQSFRLGGNAEILAFGATTEARARGFHRPLLAYIGDEAEGIDEGTFRAWHGGAAGGDVRRLMLGNPSRPSGPFHAAARGGAWTAIRLDAFDSPNLVDVSFAAAGVTGPGRTRELAEMGEEELDRVERPYLAGPRFVRDTAREYGVGSAYWTWMVRGEFPQQALDALIDQALLDAQRDREGGDEGHPIDVGIDVAGPGEDEHVIVARRGARCLAIHPFSGGDPDRLAEQTRRVLRELPERPRSVRVDSIGVGTYLVTLLREDGWPVVGVNVAEACDREDDAKRFANKKARYYWTLRERAMAGNLSGIVDPVTLSQLAEQRWREPGGRVRIRTKDEMRAAGLRSPDRAEAVMLAYADVGPIESAGTVLQPPSVARMRDAQRRRVFR